MCLYTNKQAPIPEEFRYVFKVNFQESCAIIKQSFIRLLDL